MPVRCSVYVFPGAKLYPDDVSAHALVGISLLYFDQAQQNTSGHGIVFVDIII